MSSTTRLLVLGVVRLFQPAHGYEVRRELISWHAHEWAQVQPGSIYNALKSLTRDGFLEVVGTDQVGSRPERTTYRLTATGEEEFRSLLRHEWWTVRPLIDPLMAAISFIGYVARDEAIAALEHRISQVHGLVRHLEFAGNSIDGVSVPHHVREMHWLLNARILAEVTWAQQLIARLRNHEYVTADDPPWDPASDRDKHTKAQPPSLPKPQGRSARNGTHTSNGVDKRGRGEGAGKRVAARPGPRGRARPDRVSDDRVSDDRVSGDRVSGARSATPRTTTARASGRRGSANGETAGASDFRIRRNGTGAKAATASRERRKVSSPRGARR